MADVRNSDGSCLNNALELLLGVDPGLPDWVLIDDNPAIANRLGLRYFGEGAVGFNDEDLVIVIPGSEPGKLHAIFVLADDVERFMASYRGPIYGIFLQGARQ